LASFDFDQAEGLRRMLAGPKPRIVTFLSATPSDDKGAMLVNLGASLARAGNEVLIVDACQRDYGVARRLEMERHVSLLQVARQECALNQVVQGAPGFQRGAAGARRPDLPAAGSDEARRLAKAFDVLVKAAGRHRHRRWRTEPALMAASPVPLLADSEIVVQVSTSATSITNAYALIKRLAQEFGRRPFGILVTGATEAEAKVVYDNMSAAASRYLAVTLSSMGSVPADEYLHRAARLGRAVVDAFPLAGASVAFRRLAGRFATAGDELERQGGGAHDKKEQACIPSKGKRTRTICSPSTPFVKRLAHQMKAKLPPSVEVDDLIQAGMMGLLDAINRYEDNHGAQFETYAVLRIRGAMVDELRSNDWMPRSTRSTMKKVEQAMTALQQQLGRPPTETEVAKSLDVSLSDYQEMLFEGGGHQLVYYEDFHDEDGNDSFLDRYAVDDDDPLRALLDTDFRQAVIDAIDALPPREKILMGLYYEEELNLKEIGAVLGVSESRVSQLHTQAVARLRASLKEKLWTSPA
jgi:RNA polymerase sigma factor for flagellar operon FliA